MDKRKHTLIKEILSYVPSKVDLEECYIDGNTKATTVYSTGQLQVENTETGKQGFIELTDLSAETLLKINELCSENFYFFLDIAGREG